MSAQNLHAVVNNSEQHSQAQLESYPNSQQNQYANAHKMSGGGPRQRTNNYMNSLERPAEKPHAAEQAKMVNATKHKKVHSGQITTGQKKLY